MTQPPVCAPWLAGVIYVTYIGLASLLFDAGTVPASETAIIGMTAVVANVLPALLALLVLAALAALHGWRDGVRTRALAHAAPALLMAAAVVFGISPE